MFLLSTLIRHCVPAANLPAMTLFCPIHGKKSWSQDHFTDKRKQITVRLIWTTSVTKKNDLPWTKVMSMNSRCLSLSLGLSSKENEVYENFLGNKEKQKHISSIPVKRENIYTIPNLLSLFRLISAPYLGYLIVHEQFSLAFALLAFAGISDVVDGQIARKWPSQQSAVGTALDPLADKVLVAILCLCLTYVHIMPLSLTALFLARDASLVAAVFYLRYRTCPPPRTIKRYFDPTLVNAKLAPTTISKVNTALQIILISCSVASPVFSFIDPRLLHCLWGATALTTVCSGLSYITRKDTVQIFKHEKST